MKMKDWKDVIMENENWENKIIKVDNKSYLISQKEIYIGDLVTNGVNVKRFDDSFSVLGYYKIEATEEGLGFIKLQYEQRLFEINGTKKNEYVPITKRWIDAIIGRNGICNVVDIINDKLVLDF
jgi:hypothetical protein